MLGRSESRRGDKDIGQLLHYNGASVNKVCVDVCKYREEKLRRERERKEEREAGREGVKKKGGSVGNRWISIYEFS